MRRIRDLLRLKYAQGQSSRAIAAALSISKGAVGAYLSRVRAAVLSWPLPPELDDDDALELLLFPGQIGSRVPERPVPDWGAVDRELRGKGVTRALLWEECWWRLVKLALAIGAGSEGAVHSHARRGAAEGIHAAALRQVALLAIGTLGLPSAVAASTWIEDVLKPE